MRLHTHLASPARTPASWARLAAMSRSMGSLAFETAEGGADIYAGICKAICRGLSAEELKRFAGVEGGDVGGTEDAR